MAERMIRVSKANVCPICGKPDFCLIAADGQACICARISEGSIKKCGEAGWLFILRDNPFPVHSPKPKPVKRVPPPDFCSMVKKFRKDRIGLAGLSKDLGVSVDSLIRLQVGYDGRGWLFPMSDGNQKIVGIRIRVPKGKFAVKGSKNALFWPSGVMADSDNLLFICEGPTDTAALLDLGFDAIGRASCNTGVAYIKAMIGQFERKVVIVADKDAPKIRPGGSVFYPGIEGALRLGSELKSIVRHARCIKPPDKKDVRAWYQSGATKEQVMLLVDNAKFI